MMAYFGHNSKAKQSGFEYPPVPDAYTDPYSAFGAYSGNQASVQNSLTGLHPSFYPPNGYQAMASPTPPQHPFSYQDHALEVPILRQIAPAPSVASSSDHGFPTSLPFTDHTRSPTDAPNINLVSYPAEAPSRKKRPRGTTGTIICDECGGKFTRVHSLERHNRTCHAKKVAKKSASTQRRTFKAKDASLVSDHTDHAFIAVKPRPTVPGEQNQVVGHSSNLRAMSTTSMMMNSPSAEHSSLMSGSYTPNLQSQKPISTQSYIPRGPDTSENHMNFFCDFCPEIFARRDILQLHKARIHGLTETPYLLVSGSMGRPWYLTGVTFENANKHSRRAFQTFEGGGLSSSPCQPCIMKGQNCIVNPLVSGKCVKYYIPRGIAHDPEVITAQQNNSSQAGYGAGLRPQTADYSVNPTGSNIPLSPNTFIKTPPDYSNGYPPVAQ
ncbi:MAG: hypothetical protein ASARMPREDX12_007625 [Alectoria sarmentosa]|nr:MAG: hypothetical protein ASARMPREDX12_007625 [Alectoria sarmentosa]